MRIAYQNLIDDVAASAITVTSEVVGYPIENTQDERLSKKWISDSTTTQTVVFNFGSATAIDIAAVISHNVSSASTVLIQGNATDVWTAPSSSTAITYNQNMMLKFFDSTATFQYWRFSFSGLTEVLEIGRLWLGMKLTIDPSSLRDFTVLINNSDNVLYGRGRQKYATPGVNWREIDLNFPITRGTSLTNIKTMVETVGNHSSIIFANFDTIRDYPIVEPMYCSIDGPTSFSHRNRMGFEYSLKLKEDL